MSKITRLEQLKDENALYRVTGVFPNSRICAIESLYFFHELVFVDVLSGNRVFIYQPLIEPALSKGTIKIMCLQRG